MCVCVCVIGNWQSAGLATRAAQSTPHDPGGVVAAHSTGFGRMGLAHGRSYIYFSHPHLATHGSRWPLARPGPHHVRFGRLDGHPGRQTGGVLPQGTPRAGGLRRGPGPGPGGAALSPTSAEIALAFFFFKE